MCTNIGMNDMMHLLPYTYTVCCPVHWVKAHLGYPTRLLTKSSFYVNTPNSALVVFSGSSTFLTSLVTGKMEPITAITQCWLQLGYIFINYRLYLTCVLIPQKTLFHPLVSLEWESCASLPKVQRMRDAQAVVLNNKVYVSPTDVLDPTGMMGFASNIICIYDVSGNSWKEIKSATSQHALAVYNKQVVLIGGYNHSTEDCTNELQVLQNGDLKWTKPLPPMPTKRINASAVGTGNHLAVAGGKKPVGFYPPPINTVEIYDGQGWKAAESLPKPSYRMKSVLQGDTWYLMGGKEQGREVYYASLNDLIATTSSNPATPVWKNLPKVPLENSTPAVFMNELIAIGGKESTDLHISHYGIFVPKFTSKIHAYLTSTRSWVHVADMPLYHNYDSTCATILPSGELLLVGGTVLGRTQGKP